MGENHQIDINPLRLKDAHALAPLLAAYTQSLKRGAPRRPDDYYAETLLQDRAVEVVGASLDGELVGFALFYDLPDPVSGMRHGLVDHLFVHHDHRRKGIGKALVDVIADQAEERGWARLALNAPRQPDEGRKLYEAMAAPADWTTHVIRFDQSSERTPDSDPQ
ncbi:N-acetyltransferase GCN5 [Nitratireductor aquibiodomus RA22]|uniref:Ribosomal protein S18 acetylase RimI n=2 Tax=Nitratireductor aquibiodomus TaxID=204799 RepID=A0A1H4KBP4_9HYPH|nr:GNAT family N-acetyltransferase [Nitratireductor aquibiodomus]EIM75185.1 N-acetyltransferase GCN5 [Nitratireductor aquibiodomus RA22]SEB55686.1 Ribosomal protein S18 acetylase RimI [Nitratireductor aquibiodomus]